MTPEEGIQEAKKLHELFIEAFDPEQCLDNMDDLLGELNAEEPTRPMTKEYIRATEDYFHLKAVQDALKTLDVAWLHTILDELAEAHPKF